MSIVIYQKFRNPQMLGITLWPFIILSEKIKGTKDEQVTINHEQIHIRQQAEMLVIPFYVWYILEYVIRFITNGRRAYKLLSFEKEAYKFEKDFNYLKGRKFWAFLRFM